MLCQNPMDWVQIDASSAKELGSPGVPSTKVSPITTEPSFDIPAPSSDAVFRRLIESLWVSQTKIPAETNGLKPRTLPRT